MEHSGSAVQEVGQGPWALKFNDRAAFGKFCAMLGKNHKVHFALAGFYTLIFREQPAEALKQDGEADKVYKKLKAEKALEEYLATSSGKKRYLPTLEETREMERKFTRERKERMVKKHRTGA